VIVAFLTGADIGDGVLGGFAQWLLPRIGGGSTIAWCGPVSDIALGPGHGTLRAGD